MANIFKNLLDYFHLTEDDDLDEEYDDYLEEQEEKARKKESRNQQKQRQESKPAKNSALSSQSKASYIDDLDTASTRQSLYSDSKKDARSVRTNRPDRSEGTDRSDRIDRSERFDKSSQPSKVVQFPASSRGEGSDIRIVKPTGFDDSREICDIILSKRAAIVNLEGFDIEIAQRIMDFISGSVYAVNGRLHPISNYIYIVSPDNVDISGDYLDIIKQDGFGVPTLNKGF